MYDKKKIDEELERRMKKSGTRYFQSVPDRISQHPRQEKQESERAKMQKRTGSPVIFGRRPYIDKIRNRH